jgi:hypothetical protein
MIRTLCISLLWVVTSVALAHDHENEVKAEVAQTLEQFLYGASVNDASIHDDFWAEELVYTSSSGHRFGKPDLMQGVRESGEIDEAEVEIWYGAEGVETHAVGETVVLTFTLVATPAEGNNETPVQRFFNSGVLVNQDGRWQAVNWHATRVADPQ